MKSLDSKKIAEERKNLMQLMDSGKYAIPKRKVDENIIIATWNIQKFGKTKDKRTIQYIADIIERFDIIAIQELQSDLVGLKELINILPGNYSFLVSEPIGNHERFAFIYDKRTVINSGLVSNIVFNNPGNNHDRYFLSRLPYCASFKAGRFDFTIITVHIFYGDSKNQNLREEEIKFLVEHIDKLSKDETKTFDRDIFVIGDFNINKYGDKFFNALVSKNFQMPGKMKNIKTNYNQNKTFDKISWVDRNSFCFNNKCNVLPYGNVLYQELEINERKKIISDHLPLWAEFSINKLTQQLDSIIQHK